MVELNVIGGRSSHFESYRVADNKSNGLGLDFSHNLGASIAKFRLVQYLVCLCSAQHKLIYVGSKIMLRTVCGVRSLQGFRFLDTT